jgi:hypothetical protein
MDSRKLLSATNEASRVTIYEASRHTLTGAITRRAKKTLDPAAARPYNARPTHPGVGHKL